MDNVSSSFVRTPGFRYRTYIPVSIGTTDYVVLYAPLGQTGETALLLSSTPTVDLTDAANATANFTNGILTLNYAAPNGSHFISVKSGSQTFVVVLMNKSTAYQWHAPIIPGSGTFGGYFGVGTNAS